MKTNIILLSGRQGSGKSTLARNLKEFFNEKGKIAFVNRFAGPLYEMQDAIRGVAAKYNIPFEKKEGKLLQLLGTEWGRNTKGENVWVNAVDFGIKEDARRLQYSDEVCNFDEAFFIIEDCRFKNELSAFPNAFSVRLLADRDVRKNRADAWREDETHQSETDLDAEEESGKFDYMLKTDGGDDAMRVARLTGVAAIEFFAKQV